VAIETAATLLEREREIAALGEALDAARAGRGGVVLVEAPAGLGKTSLLRAATETAEAAGIRCRRARAGELERDFAYGCVRQLLEPVAARAPDAERERLFAGAAAPARALLAPAGLPPASAAVDGSLSILHGLYWLLNNLASDGPVLLVVDDLHWADAETLRFLAFLAPRLEGLPLAVLASTRPEEGVTADLARLAVAPEATVLRPQPLSAAATARLCRLRLGDPVAEEFVAACRIATGGNPFYLEALLREATERGIGTDARAAVRVRGIGPAAVAHAVLLRLSGAPTAASALARAVAILGDGASLAEAARLAGEDESEAARAADLMAGLGILRAEEGLGFVHPIVREAVYADIGPRERAEAHARAALSLAAGGASDERVAAQIVAAEPAADAGRVALLRRVASDALARGAPAAAVAWLRRALAEPPPAAAMGEVLLELGSAELRAGAPEAASHLAEAVALLGDPAGLALAARLHANALTMSDRADESLRALEAAIEAIEPTDRERALMLEAELAAHSQEADREARAPAARRLEGLRHLAGATPGERLVLATLAFERARGAATQAEAAALIEEALAGGRLLAEQELDVTGTFYLLIVGLRATDALELAEAALDGALADARSRASIPAVAFALAHRGYVAMRRGAVHRSEADARTALELLQAHGIPLGTALTTAVLVEALVEGGEVEAAAAALEASPFAQDIPPGLPSNPLLEARGGLRLAQGRADDALADLAEFGRRDELWGGASPLASRWRSRASEALAAAGDAAGATRMAAEDLALARRWRAASGIGIALRAVALTAGGEEQIDGLRAAVAALEPSPARLGHARALVDLGAALRRANRRREARAELREGLALAERCGARALAERARAELRAAGGRSSASEGSGWERLTASERRVAELAAEGKGNPEIAQTLYVTRKTVETHLGHVYRKLGIAGRGELERALASGAAGGAA
jgi:DNA-binding CsgD family transcriptional regulator/tetratricopeptide (TPR) repeat protein